MTLKEVNGLLSNTLMEHLDISIIEVGSDDLIMQMPVNKKVHQPMGLLHGGASAALAESAGSLLSVIHIDQEKYIALGLEISANHVRSKSEGMVYAHARFRHKGRRTHLVEIVISDENKKPISICKMTNIILSKEFKA